MMFSDNVFLVGLMGAGKTTIGRIVAKRLGKRFLDSDHEIESRCGVRIPVIFELEGETGFRARERAAIEELTSLHDIVLATGGGAVLAEKNRELLARRGTVVYLDARPDDLARRVRRDRNRPLLAQSDPAVKLRQLHVERDALYRGIADIVVSTGTQSPHSLGRRLVSEIENGWKRSA